MFHFIIAQNLQIRIFNLRKNFAEITETQRRDLEFPNDTCITYENTTDMDWIFRQFFQLLKEIRNGFGLNLFSVNLTINGSFFGQTGLVDEHPLPGPLQDDQGRQGRYTLSQDLSRMIRDAKVNTPSPFRFQCKS